MATEIQQFIPLQEHSKELEASSSEKQAPNIDINLLKQIQKIGHLPSELFRKRYESLDGFDISPKQEANSSRIDPLPLNAALEVANMLAKEDDKNYSEPEELEIKSIVEALINNPDNALYSQNISRIAKWAARDPETRIENIEKRLALHFQKGGKINMTLLALLAELNAHKTDFAINFDLIKSLEKDHSFPSKLKDQIAVLNRLNQKEANFLLHKILDFIKNYIITTQNNFQFDATQIGFFMAFQELAKLEMEYSHNYLNQKHLLDIVEMSDVYNPDKPDTLAGIPGGASDEMIYRFRHAQNSYANRRKLGINEGYPVKNPVLPIAQGFFGFYEEGKLIKVYPEQGNENADWFLEDQKYIAQNDFRDEYIYDKLNQPIENENKSSEGLQKRHVLNRFIKGIQNNRAFYFDTSKIAMDSLHPVIAAEILLHNQKYLHQIYGKTNSAESLPADKYNELVFPLKNIDPEKECAYRYLTSLGMRKRVEEDFDIQMENFTMWEQRNFLAFLERLTVEEVADLQNFIKQFGKPGLKTFLSLEFDPEAGPKILELARQIPQEKMNALLTNYSKLVTYAEKNSEKLAQEFKQPDEQTSFQSAVFEGLLVRAKDVLMTAHLKIVKEDGNGETVVNATITELQQESPKQQTISGFFRQTAELLEYREHGTVNIETFIQKQDEILQELKNNNGLGMFLRALSARGELSEIPEIHWQVDRGLEEYKRRFGFDIGALIKELTNPNKKKILLEFGPGSGQSKAERAELQESKHWMDVAMADKVYYPLDGFISKMLDWEKLEQVIGAEFSQNDKIMLSDMLYKVMMIQDGQTAQDHFDYHQDRVERIKKDPNSIRQILPEIAPQLNQIDFIPTILSTRDNEGNVVYEYKHNIKEAKEKSPAFARGLLEIGNPEKISQYILDKDGYEAVPAYPVGMMIGDFSRISALGDKQIDLAIGVRSTVYKRGKEYVDFLVEASKKLALHGLYISDDIRDNDGWYYRLSEVLEFYNKIEPKKNNLHIAVILGNGFHGEDYRIDKVPSALVISKGKDYNAVIAANLDQGYEIVTFEDLISEEGIKKYDIAGLDSTGHTLERLQKEFHFGNPPSLRRRGQGGRLI